MAILKVVEDGVQFSVRAQPKASRSRVAGVLGDRLKVAVTAAPSGGKANRAIEEVVAEAFGVRASAVAVVAGQTSREKVVRIAGLSAEEAERRLKNVLNGVKRS